MSRTMRINTFAAWLLLLFYLVSPTWGKFPDGFECPGPEFKQPMFLKNKPQSYSRVSGEVVRTGEDAIDDPAKCVHGPNRLKLSPFDVWICCGGGLGNTLGIVLTNRNSNTIGNLWETKKDLWQEAPWSNDVTSFGWGYDPCMLFVGTCGVYGDPGLYLLNLCERSAKRLYPKIPHRQLRMINSIDLIEIESILSSAVVIKVFQSNLGQEETRISRIRLNLIAPKTSRKPKATKK